MRLKALVWIVRPGPLVLLLARPDRRGGGLHPVTGKADRGESPRACAEREAFEETGLRGALRDLGLRHEFDSGRRRFVEHAFALFVEDGQDPVLSDEHVGFRWAEPGDALAAVEWPAHRASLERALAVVTGAPPARS